MQEFEKSKKRSAPPAKKFLSSQDYNLLPQFLKAGLTYLQKYENVRRQGFRQRLIVCELLKMKGNTLFNENQTKEACCQYEQVRHHFLKTSLTPV